MADADITGEDVAGGFRMGLSFARKANARVEYGPIEMRLDSEDVICLKALNLDAEAAGRGRLNLVYIKYACKVLRLHEGVATPDMSAIGGTAA
jgi:hypothetical protein